MSPIAFLNSSTRMAFLPSSILGSVMLDTSSMAFWISVHRSLLFGWQSCSALRELIMAVLLSTADLGTLPCAGFCLLSFAIVLFSYPIAFDLLAF